jgi:phosphatidate cytidylyltransferase
VLAARLATAVVGVPILLALIVIGGWPFGLAAAAAAGLSARETYALLRTGTAGSEDRSLDWPGLAAIVGSGFLVAAATAGAAAVLAALAIALLGLLTLTLAAPVRSGAWIASLAAIVYPGLPLGLLVLTRNRPNVATAVIPLRPLIGGGERALMVSDAAGWVLLLFTAVWATDTAAYVVGRTVGRHPFWPRVSPSKTWEGTAAGLVGGTLVGVAWSLVLPLSPASGAVLGLALALAAVVGDLAESDLKRSAGAKDAGALLPGHGGLLDRIDGLAFASVVIFLHGLLWGTT